MTMEYDADAFTIPCIIGVYQFVWAIYDLGASINLMPLEIFKQLGFEDLSPTTMRLVAIFFDVLV